MPRPLPSPPAARLLGYCSLCALVLSSIPIVGCYTGPDYTEGMPWGGDGDEDDDDNDSAAAGTDGAGESSSASGSGANDGADGADAGDAGDAGETGAGDAGDAGETGASDAGDAGDAGDESSGGADSGDPIDDSVPDNAYCMPVSGWDPTWTALEDEILEIVNEVRASGANCGSAGNFGPAGPLTMQPALRCSARVHSKDMNDRSFFDHTNPSGESPWDRMEQAGYNFSNAGENIAGGNSTAAATMQQWMDSDGHCGNIMNPNFTEIGVGYYPGGQWGHLWTQNFGRP
jgi:uncharacterized protein YkwD